MSWRPPDAALADAALDRRSRPRPREAAEGAGEEGEEAEAEAASGGELPQEREDGWFGRTAAPWLDPRSRGIRGTSGRHAVAWTARSARAQGRGNNKVHLLAAVTIPASDRAGQGRQSGKANEISHFRLLLARCRWTGPWLPATRCRRTGTTPVPRKVKKAHHRGRLGNQPT